MENLYEMLYMWHQNDSYAQNYLVNYYEPIIRSMAVDLCRRNADLDIEPEDLIDEGRFGVAVSAETYRYDRNCSFRTYAPLVIRRRMYAALRSCARQKNIRRSRFVYLDDDEEMRMPRYDVWESGDVMSRPQYCMHYHMAAAEARHTYDEMSEKEQKALQLYNGGHTYREAAEIMGTTVKGYNAVLIRAKNKVRSAVMHGIS